MRLGLLITIFFCQHKCHCSHKLNINSSKTIQFDFVTIKQICLSVDAHFHKCYDLIALWGQAEESKPTESLFKPNFIIIIIVVGRLKGTDVRTLWRFCLALSFGQSAFSVEATAQWDQRPECSSISRVRLRNKLCLKSCQTLNTTCGPHNFKGLF